MARIPIALQLYSVREDCQKDLPGTLEAVAGMGYEGVDFAGYYGYEAKEIRTMLDDLGLRAAGCHTAIETLMGDELAQTVEFNQTLGNRFLIVPGLAEKYRSSREAWQRTAELFNEIAARLEPEDMYTGYHNHAIEFAPYEDGLTPWDVIYGNTVERVVMQIDVGNALHGGGDPLECLRRYPGRALTVHLKDYAEGKDLVILGEGDVDWPQIFEEVEGQGKTEWYIVEQENYPYSPLESARRCLENLKAMGK